MKKLLTGVLLFTALAGGSAFASNGSNKTHLHSGQATVAQASTKKPAKPPVTSSTGGNTQTKKPAAK